MVCPGDQQRRGLLALVLCLLAALAAPGALAQQDDAGDAQGPLGEWFTQPSIHESLSPVDPAPNLNTPQATVETFVLACRDGDWPRAARTLNFRLRPAVDDQAAARLAEQLFFVLNQELWIDWEGLPDRPDGVTSGSALTTSTAPLAGEPRRSIKIGSINLRGRSVPIRVQRVAAASGDPEPVWLFSAQTVDNIEALYEAHGPSWLATRMPDWARTRGPVRVPVWQWIVLVAGVGAAFLVGWATAKLISRRMFSVLPGHAEKTASALRPPIAALAGAVVFWIIVASVLALPSPTATVVEMIARIALVAAASWLAMRVVTYSSSAISESFIRSDDDDGKISSEQRRLLTQLTVARYVVLLIVALVAVAVVLIQLDMFRAVGVALLTSAGAAAVILGIAGHAVLGNLIAGLQIALTRPFRIGDTVMIEGNWGVIEDISYTYVVERTWDDRRLIIPIKYFINEHFDNWSKTDEYLTKPIYLNVDYRADIQRIREKFFELLEADDDWDPDIDDPQVLAYECGDETMTVRLTCGAKDSSTIWQLHCRMREQIIAWLQGVENGAWLPRQRVMLDPSQHDRDDDHERNGRSRSGPRSHAHARSGGNEDGDSGGDGH